MRVVHVGSVAVGTWRGSADGIGSCTRSVRTEDGGGALHRGGWGWLGEGMAGLGGVIAVGHVIWQRGPLWTRICAAGGAGGTWSCRGVVAIVGVFCNTGRGMDKEVGGMMVDCPIYIF